MTAENSASPAKAGVHLSMARAADEWVPAFGGTAARTQFHPKRAVGRCRTRNGMRSIYSRTLVKDDRTRIGAHVQRDVGARILQYQCHWKAPLETDPVGRRRHIGQ